MRFAGLVASGGTLACQHIRIFRYAQLWMAQASAAAGELSENLVELRNFGEGEIWHEVNNSRNSRIILRIELLDAGNKITGA